MVQVVHRTLQPEAKLGLLMLELVRVNQELAPDDLADGGSNWEDLAIVTITGTDLVVELSNAANEYVIADAIRVAASTDAPSLNTS